MASPSEFLKNMMRRLLVCLQQREEDNYAAARFSFDGVDRSNEFNLEYHADQGNNSQTQTEVGDLGLPQIQRLL